MRKFLFLVLTITLMLFVSFNVFAADDDPMPFSQRTGFGPAETDPMLVHKAANGRNSIQTAITTTGSSSAENVVTNYDCPSCKTPNGILDNTGTQSDGTVIDQNGNPVDINK